MDSLEQQVEQVVRADWLSTALAVVVILAATMVVAQLATHFLRRILNFGEDRSLPSSSIFVNIVRAAVWVMGVCIMLSTCFNVDVSAAVTALGIGGIAVSLGFQDTISNLIGGLQVSLMRIVKPGDNVQVSGTAGLVKDVTWRHTTITNSKGQEIIIPNSIINKTALVQLPPLSKITVPFVVKGTARGLDQVAVDIACAALAAAQGVGAVAKEPSVLFSEITDGGFAGSVILYMEDEDCSTEATDAIVRAIAPLTRPCAK